MCKVKLFYPNTLKTMYVMIDNLINLIKSTSKKIISVHPTPNNIFYLNIVNGRVRIVLKAG